jgi:hypothetical protein
VVREFGCDEASRTYGSDHVPFRDQLLERDQHRGTGDSEIIREATGGGDTDPTGEASGKNRVANASIHLAVQRLGGIRIKRDKKVGDL